MGHSMGAATVMRVGAEYPDLPRAVIMLDPLLGPLPPGAPGAPGRSGPAGPRHATSARPPGAVSMFGTPEALVAQNDYTFDDLVAACRTQNSKWDPVDCQYWALSKKQYHSPYSTTEMQAMTGTMQIGDSLSRITAPALILKADARPEIRKRNAEAASVMKDGKLVHIDGAGHNLHHDQRKRTVEVLTDFLSTL
jgi:pimeloyl-ACP methyl ester carboxylesterase